MIDVWLGMFVTGGAALLCLRNSRNETAREMALSLNLPAHVNVIDETVTDWLTSEKGERGGDECRSLLALYSYELGAQLDANCHVERVAIYKQEFYRLQVSSLLTDWPINQRLHFDRKMD